jgi:hypothetical protein
MDIIRTGLRQLSIWRESSPIFISLPDFRKFRTVQEFFRAGKCNELKIPFTGHPMFGHDIIYTHPVNYGSAIGRTAETDFLYFAQSVSNLDFGVYLSVGSAVMSPMIFEKSLSMSQNLAIQQGNIHDNHFMLIVDLAESDWDWANDGEPPMDNPPTTCVTVKHLTVWAAKCTT